jgi:tRNA(Ile)-lysidine synthase
VSSHKSTEALEARAAATLAGFSKTRRMLIGVSGGRDSVALLHLLAGFGFTKLVVCHLDHGLRGRTGAADARFVERLAGQLGLTVIVEKLDVAALAAERKLSLETAAREARYDFFGQTARETGWGTLFLGHHADDQAETFLFNLLRGAGGAGLGAMRPVTRRGALTIVRPLLGVWRAEIDAFVKARRIKFREDASNTSPAHTRNRLRHEILPLLEKAMGRDVRRSLWRTAEILAAENEWVESLVPVPAAELSTGELGRLPVAAQRRLLRGWLLRAGISDTGFDDVEAVRGLLENAGPSKVNLPGARHARRRAKKIFIE